MLQALGDLPGRGLRCLHQDPVGAGPMVLTQPGPSGLKGHRESTAGSLGPADPTSKPVVSCKATGLALAACVLRVICPGLSTGSAVPGLLGGCPPGGSVPPQAAPPSTLLVPWAARVWLWGQARCSGQDAQCWGDCVWVGTLGSWAPLQPHRSALEGLDPWRPSPRHSPPRARVGFLACREPRPLRAIKPSCRWQWRGLQLPQRPCSQAVSPSGERVFAV